MPDDFKNPTLPEVDPTEVEDSRVVTASQHDTFLEKVMTQSGLADRFISNASY